MNYKNKKNDSEFTFFSVVLPLIILVEILFLANTTQISAAKQENFVYSKQPLIFNNVLNQFSDFHLSPEETTSFLLLKDANDPRTEYDTPDPDDPANIKKFRVKTENLTDDQIKQNLVSGDVYAKIQRIKIEGKTAYVSTPNELLNALWDRKGAYKAGDTFPNELTINENITRIVLTKDISIGSPTVPGYQDFASLRYMTDGHIPNRNIVIDGIDPINGVKHTLDMHGSFLDAYGYNDSRIGINSNNYTSEFVMNNINLQGTDYFGPVSAYTNAVKKRIIYRNVKYLGAQLGASYYTNITFTGKNDISSVVSYQALEPQKQSDGSFDVRPGRYLYAYANVPPGGTVFNYYSEQILECSSVTFAYNSRFDGYAATTAPFRIGFSGGASEVHVMDYAQINLEGTNKGQRQEMPQCAMIQVWNGNFEIHPHATVKLNAYDYVAPDGVDSTNPVNKPNTGFSRDLIGLYGGNAQFKIDDYASVYGIQNGRIGLGGVSYASVYLGAGSSIDVGKWAKFTIKSVNANSTVSNPVLQMDASSKINVQQPGTFDLQGDGEFTGDRSLMSLGTNSVFKFDHARMVNIQYNGSQQRTNLIKMATGTMSVKNMDIYAWNYGNTYATGTHPDAYDNVEGKDYFWPSIFNFVANYNNYGFVNIDSTALSLNPRDIDDMRLNYNTNKFQRVMFHYIPNVYAKFTSQPVDDPTDPNSYTISGQTYTENVNDPDGDDLPLRDTYVRLRGHVKNTAAASEVGSVDLDQPFQNTVVPDPRWVDLSSWDIDVKSNFSAISDENGNFTVKLPKDAVTDVQKTFMASDPNDLTNTGPVSNGRIQAFAFKAGNYNSVNIAVLDKVPPKATALPLRYILARPTAPDPKTFVDLSTVKDLDKNTHSNAFTQLKDYKFEYNQSLAPNFWNTAVNNAPISIKVTDPSGNATIVESHVTISQLPVFIEINKPNIVAKLPTGSSTWTPTQWQNWVKTNNPNQARALKINPDGSLTDITSQMTNNASNFKKGINNITYTVPTGDVAPKPISVSSNAEIELRTDTLKLELPLDSKSQVKSINFGRYGTYNTGYLTAKITKNYPALIIDDRVDKTLDWNLSLQAEAFKGANSGGSTQSVDTINLGMLDSSTDIFQGIIGPSVEIAQGTGDSSLDIMTGNGLINTDQKLVINRPLTDINLDKNTFNSKLVWTLVQATP